MGKTFAINTKFESRGFKLIGIFDSDPKKFGTMIGIHRVLPYSRIREFISENKPQMAILAIPKTAMHEVANQLISYGIKAFMNFSYTELSTPDDIAVENVHLGDSLMRLSYKLTEKQNSEKTVKRIRMVALLWLSIKTLPSIPLTRLSAVNASAGT